jgi:hypothetical protein
VGEKNGGKTPNSDKKNTPRRKKGKRAEKLGKRSRTVSEQWKVFFLLEKVKRSSEKSQSA